MNNLNHLVGEIKEGFFNFIDIFMAIFKGFINILDTAILPIK